MALHDNRKKVTLINGRVFKLPPWCIIENARSVHLHLATGNRLFAKWYVVSVK